MKPTADWAGFKGRKNGDLLRSAEAAGYHVFLTVDQGIPHEQGAERRKIFHDCNPLAHQPELKDLLPLVDPILSALEALEPGQTKLISLPE
jgi:hypothetical protein